CGPVVGLDSSGTRAPVVGASCLAAAQLRDWTAVAAGWLHAEQWCDGWCEVDDRPRVVEHGVRDTGPRGDEPAAAAMVSAPQWRGRPADDAEPRRARSGDRRGPVPDDEHGEEPAGPP